MNRKVKEREREEEKGIREIGFRECNPNQSLYQFRLDLIRKASLLTCRFHGDGYYLLFTRIFTGRSCRGLGKLVRLQRNSRYEYIHKEGY